MQGKSTEDRDAGHEQNTQETGTRSEGRKAQPEAALRGSLHATEKGKLLPLDQARPVLRAAFTCTSAGAGGGGLAGVVDLGTSWAPTS